jgi:tetratricopeptide (TPR) repeat protein
MKTEVRRMLGAAVACLALLPLTASGSSQQKPEALIAQGDAYARKGEYGKAIADYTEAIRLEPKNAVVYAKRSWSYARKGDFDRAFADCAEALRLDPKLALAYSNRGLCHAAKGEYERALADCTEAVRLEPKSADAYYRRGWSYYVKHEYDKAIADHSDAIQLDPKEAEIYFSRGVCYVGKRAYDKAIADYTEAIRLDAKKKDAYYERGWSFYVKGHDNEAIADCTEVIRLDPKFMGAYNLRGLCYAQRGDHDKAIADYNEAIGLDPKYVVAYSNRGECYYSRRDYDRAIADFSEAIRLDPKFAPAYSGRGKCYYQKGQYQKALDDYTGAARLDPNIKIPGLIADAPDPKKSSINNLKQLYLALTYFHDTHAEFPPARFHHKDPGKPLFSWRVDILPFLEEEKLWKEFRHNEPWDSEHNKKLLGKMPRLLAPVTGHPKEKNTTHYQVIIGGGALFDFKKRINMKDIKDGAANTIMIVEAEETVPWTKPADVIYDPDKPLPKFGGLFMDGFHAVFADGTVRFIKNDTDEKLIRALITRAGGEAVDLKKLN